jgi:hypothetical protein
MDSNTDNVSILIVEDELITAFDIAETLKKFGFTVAGSADNGSDAIDLAGKHRPDIILMDIGLKGEYDGIAAAGIIRERFGIPVIYMTGNADLVTVRKARDTAPYGYVVKPVNRESLYSTIDSALQRFSLEKLLRQSEERYRLIFANSPIGIFFYDTSLVIRESNNRFIEILRSKTELIVGLDMNKLNDKRVLPSIKEAIAGSDGYYEGEYMVTTSGAVIWVVIKTVPVYSQNGEVMGGIGIVEDLSEKMESASERAKLEEQVIQMQKMESIGRLAGGIAHDFNNILFSILGHAELGLLSVKPEDQLYEPLLEIMRAGEKAKNLTRQLLAFGRKQILEFNIIDINSLISDFEKLMKRLIGEDIEVQLGLSEASGLIKGDRTQMEQVLLNLAVNARDALPAGGTISITTGGYTAEIEPAVPGLQPGNYVTLFFSDNGVGIDKESIDRIFEPFFTTKAKGKGTGLGLSTVYGIVKQHGGEILVSSEPGQGTLFRLYLPEAVGMVSEPEERGPAGAEEYNCNETILVVEDEEMVRKLVVSILRGRGYTVVETGDPKEALELSRSHEGRIDLLLTDIVMRSMNGRELYETIITERNDIKVLYMSGYTADIISHHGVLNEGVNYIQKPFTVEALRDRVRRAIDSDK